MKNVLVINLHSFIDVITNSSTELFVIDADKSIEMIKDILKEMINHRNEIANKGYVYTRAGEMCTFEECFGDIYVYTKEMYELDKQGLKDSYGDGWGYEEERNIGKIIIEGKTDNSIPYEMFDWIECKLNAERWHLG